MGTKVEWAEGMSKVVLMTAHTGDGAALRELLAADGHKVELVGEVRDGLALGVRADVIVADHEPWTWEGRALIERLSPALGDGRLILLCARVPRGSPPPGVRYLPKPIALDELRAAIAGLVYERGSEAA
jgi:DNA-binding response OmpR family regulator